MLRLSLVFLHVTTDEDIEKLVSSTEFDIGANFDGVPALHDGILKFVETDFLAGIEAVAEIFTLEHLLQGDAGIEFENFLIAHLAEPIAVINDFSLIAVENFKCLLGVGGCID